MVQKYVEKYIHATIGQGRTIIVEGVHIDPEFQQRMIEIYGQQCQCFVNVLEDQYEHMKRSKTRPEGNANPQLNKYTKNYAEVAEIQDHLME